MADQWARSDEQSADDPDAGGVARRRSRLTTPRWVLAVLAFVVGAGALAAVAGLSDTFGGDATPAALETAFERGFTAGEREAATAAEQDAQFAATLAAADSAGYSRGLRQGLTESNTVFVPKFAVSAGQDAVVVFAIEDKAAACESGLPEALLALIGVTGCETEDSEHALSE